MTDPNHLGSKLGPRLAKVVSDAMADHHRKTAHTRAKIGTQAALDFFGTINAETRETVSPIYHLLAEHPDMAPEFADLFRFLRRAPGEWSALLSYGIYGTGISTGLGAIFNNWLAPTVQSILADGPNSVLPAGGAAGLVAKGFWSPARGLQEAAKQAIDTERFDGLLELAVERPTPSMLFELYNRGLIGPGDLHTGIKQLGYNDGPAALIAKLHRTHIAPADLADMVVKGIIEQGAGETAAQVFGVTAADFDLLVKDSGEPPGVQDLLFAYRRNLIDKARLEHGIRQGRTKNEWIDVIESLRHIPMSTSDALRAVVQNHLSADEGRRIADMNGLRPEDWQPLLETEGNPISPTEALSLLNRGLVDKAFVEQAIREGRIKNKYIPNILQLRRRLLPERMIVQMVAHGTLTHRSGIEHLLEEGYSDQDAHALVDQGAATKVTKEKEFVKGDILNLYRDRAIDEHVATRWLKALGWSAEECRLLLATAELARAQRFRDAAINHAHSLYVAHTITETEASSALDGYGVPHAQRDDLLHIWTLERQVNKRHLTEAQIVKGAKVGVIPAGIAEERLIRLGYDQADAATLVAIG